MVDRIETIESSCASVSVAMDLVSADGTAAIDDLVTTEEPLEIRLSYRSDDHRIEQSISITMRTPGADGELALGFLAGEGIISSIDEVLRVEHCGPPSPDKGLRNVIKVELADHVRVDPGGLLRHFYTTSSCGVCGKASLDAIRVLLEPKGRSVFSIASESLYLLPQGLAARQVEFARTGGLHAAAAFDAMGAIVRICEDVGRHNAFDKLVGGFLCGDGLDEAGLGRFGVLLSGRASFELVQKAAAAGVELIASIGPPSSLAVELARDQRITLVGFLKSDRFNLYCCPERVRR